MDRNSGLDTLLQVQDVPGDDESEGRNKRCWKRPQRFSVPGVVGASRSLKLSRMIQIGVISRSQKIINCQLLHAGMFMFGTLVLPFFFGFNIRNIT